MLRLRSLLLMFAVCCALVPGQAETLRNPFRIPTPVDPASVAVGDLNADGLGDLVWGDSASPATLHILLSQPGGGWTAPGAASIFYPIATTRPPVCLIEDLNHDGRQDLVCVGAYQFTMYLHVFLGNGDGTFQPPIATPLTTISPGAYAAPEIAPVGDLNNDGFPDLYLIEAESQQAHVLLSDGKGGFKAPIAAPNGINGVLPVAADLNGDGVLDLVFPQGPEVALGKGDGTFAPLIDYSVPSDYAAICVFHDMDGDGHLDAVCGYEETTNGDIDGASDLIVLHGNADGSFNTDPIARKTFGDRDTVEDGLGTFLTPIGVADLNGDGILDILATAGDGLTVLLGDGSEGSLAYGAPSHYAQAVVSDQEVSGHYQSLVYDVNGDGIPDLVDTGPNGIYISYGKHDGTYGSAFAPEVAEVITYATVADFNGDGIPDIVAAGDTKLKLSLGKGDGTFTAPVALPNNGAIDYSQGRFFSDVLHGDFNGDGKQDLFAAGVFNDGVSDSAGGFHLYFGKGDGTFADPVLVSPNPDAIFNPQSLNDVGVWDFNGDGRDDLLVLYTTAAAGVLQADLSNGDGSFKIVSTAVPVDTEGALSIPAIADFNGDGKLDAVYGSVTGAYFVKGHGDGAFDTAPATMPIPQLSGISSAGALSAAAGDFDGDGFADFALLVNYSSGTGIDFPHPEATAAYVYYGHGDGTFSAPVLAGIFNHNFQLVAAADLNKDGLADLVLRTDGSDYNEYAVAVVHSLAGRSFGAEIDYTAGTGVSSLAIADLNKDGFPDLVFGNGDSNIVAGSVTVLLNEGNAALVTGTLTTSPNPTVVGQDFTLTATLTPPVPATLAGSVEFFVDGGYFFSEALSGNVATERIISELGPGSHEITAVWPGDSTYPALTLYATHVVTGAASAATLTSSSNPAKVGSAVTFTASVASAAAGTPTGTVAFADGGTPLGTVPLVEGSCALTTSALAVGKHSITAAYSGDSLFGGSTASLVEVVQALATTTTLATTPNPAYAWQQIDAIATVSAGAGNPPTGELTLNANGLPLASAALMSGSVGFAISFPAAGDYALTASYAGDAENSASASAALTQKVLINPTTTVIAGSTSPALAFHPIAFTASVASTTVVRQPSPDGTVTFYAGSTRLGSTAASVPLSFTTTALAAGDYAITAVYSGSKAFAPSSSAPFSLRVERAPAAIALTSSMNPALVGTAVTFTATVSGPPTPTGAVTFADHGVALGAPVPLNAQGEARLRTNTLALGTHPIAASYAGDANLSAASSPVLEQSIVAYTGDFTIQATPASATFYTGESATFHIAVAPVNGFNYPLALTCSGLPANTTCAFSQKSLPTGEGQATLLVQSTAPHAAAAAERGWPWPRNSSTSTGVVLAACLLLWPVRRRRGLYRRWLAVGLLGIAGLASIGCANNRPIAGGTPPGVYTVVVTAYTSGSGPARSHSTTITLNVNSLF